jgi:3-oxo-5alpha-steroid 4-dehydrogenase
MSDRIDTKQAVEPARPPLDVDGPDALAWNEEVDVVIVGFGGAGPATAIEAKERGFEALVVERF